MTEIDTYERECLKSVTAVKVTMDDASKRMRAFLAEQQEHLQSVKVTNADEFALHLDEADKLAQELNDRKKANELLVRSRRINTVLSILPVVVAANQSLVMRDKRLVALALQLQVLDLQLVNVALVVDGCGSGRLDVGEEEAREAHFVGYGATLRTMAAHAEPAAKYSKIHACIHQYTKFISTESACSLSSLSRNWDIKHASIHSLNTNRATNILHLSWNTSEHREKLNNTPRQRDLHFRSADDLHS